MPPHPREQHRRGSRHPAPAYFVARRPRWLTPLFASRVSLAHLRRAQSQRIAVADPVLPCRSHDTGIIVGRVSARPPRSRAATHRSKCSLPARARFSSPRCAHVSHAARPLQDHVQMMSLVHEEEFDPEAQPHAAERGMYADSIELLGGQRLDASRQTPSH
ncbi:MAG: hypothetical protein JWO97_629 [Acidobacteria bacterium]|nr:hypothetical protein [Acidobacteriota bacterium]